jgi:hypothetical protein
MDCVNHAGKSAAAYCQSCGKALCVDCVAAGAMNPAARGMILCPNCLTAWVAANPFVPPRPGVPNPSVAAVLGVLPGVGAMYNGQFVKGLIHVVIFAVLVSAAHVYGIFGLFIAAWIAYQSFEAYHTAKARRDGTPLPDPLGLNELGSVFNIGAAQPAQPNPNQTPGQPPAAAPAPDPAASQGPASQQAPFTPPYQQPPYQAPFGGPYTPPGAGFPGPGIPPVPPIPPIPPVPPPSCGWGRREPIGAIVLIVLGVLFALGQMDFFSARIFEFSWPLLLIGLGVWLIARRIGDLRGGK